MTSYRFTPFLGLCIITVIFACIFRDYFNFNKGQTCNFDIKANEQRWRNLKKNLTGEIYGQHIATDIVLRALYSHVTDPVPSKALVMSFHGSLGSGKTLMSQLIANNFYDGGFDSPFVHSYIGPLTFVKDPAKLKENQEKLRQDIQKSVETCGRSLFVFDEVDKMPPEIFDVIVPFIDHHQSIDGVDYRGLTFIFLSNTGATLINELVYRHKRNSQARETISGDDFQKLIAQGAFTETGGLFEAEMIEKRLIDFYVPFLPLEKEHIIMCARRDIIKRRVLFVSPEKVADKIWYGPEDLKVFSEDGCKTVTNHVNFFIQDHLFGDDDL